MRRSPALTIRVPARGIAPGKVQGLETAPGAVRATPAPASGALPYQGRALTEDDWIAENAAALLDVLADEGVRAEILALLADDDSERRRARRLEAARRELEGLGLPWDE
jgi:hypothetical protein